MDMPMPTGGSPAPPMPDASSHVSAYAQQIADAAKKLPIEDLTALMHGISPEALEVMEKIPDLAAFANFIENGGGDAPDGDDAGPMPGKPAVVIAIGAKKDPRDDVVQAMAKHGMR